MSWWSLETLRYNHGTCRAFSTLFTLLFTSKNEDSDEMFILKGLSSCAFLFIYQVSKLTVAKHSGSQSLFFIFLIS